MAEVIIINSLMAGIAGGIIGAVIIFLTTIIGISGKSKSAKFLKSSIWKKFGYNVSWSGSIIGAILGFIYGFVIWYVFSIIYNSLI